MLMNLCNGVYQNSIYGVVADFPDNYPNSLIIGNNLCGIFTSVMSIFTTVGMSPLQPYYRHIMAIGERARLDDDAERPSPAQYLDCLSYCWVQLFNNFFVYFVTLIIFPAMMSETPFYRQPGEPWGSALPGNILDSICFLIGRQSFL
ncbi:hypothetical protein ANCDUO_23686 [Ancylostoma duodenale]|uniref:Nucleoside transporter n=1 Tax=Ancylostoma duodenale TaxID=51022 RepID=A0A0C2FHQ9_9BILA|nr:hypothetical protein ANCDUO_23686 [Ancylostoma duodenale]